MSRFFRHLRALWPGLTILAPLPFVLHGAWAAARGELRWENVAVLGVLVCLFTIGPRTKKLLLGLYPLGLVGVLYETMKLFEGVGLSPSRIHVCDLRRAELALFGVRYGGHRVTLHDWFQAHPSALLDRVCAVPYGTFLFVCTAFAAWLYFRDYPRMLRFGWSWFALNVAGFITYHLYPAAPPWYYHLHGCRVDLAVHASEGPNLARVDAWLGFRFFHGMYGRSSDVFGAVPSLHVAYALIIALEGWPVMGALLRAASVTFFVWMSFSAVYLDHHWVIDVLAGVAYCLTVMGIARVIAPSRAPDEAPIVGPDGAEAPIGDALAPSKPVTTPLDGAP